MSVQRESIALQFGADGETIRKALCRDSRSRPGGPLGAALDRVAASPLCVPER